MKRLSLAAVLAVILAVPTGAVVGSHAAFADTNGASVVNQTSCFSYPWGGGTCFTAKGESNTTMASDGSISVELNGTMMQTFFDSTGAVSAFSSTNAVHYHSLALNGIVRESGNHTVSTFTFLGGSCSYYSNFHVANGNIQYNDFSYTC